MGRISFHTYAASCVAASGTRRPCSQSRILVALRFAVIGLSHADDAMNLAAGCEHTDPDSLFDHSVGDKSFLGKVEAHVRHVQPVFVCKNLGAECLGHTVLVQPKKAEKKSDECARTPKPLS